MRLTWELVDLQQTVLARLDNRKAGSNVTIEHNGGRFATCLLSPEDPAAALAAPLTSVLRVRVDGWTDPLFCGRVYIPDERADTSQDVLTLNAYDPFAALERAVIRDINTTPTPDQLQFHRFGPADQSTIMWDVANYDSAGKGHGIRQGSLAAASVSRTLTYPLLMSLAEIERVIAGLENGPDFELAPVIATDGSLAQFNTFYPKLGTDKSNDVIFEYGHGAQNVLAYATTPGGDQVCNRLIVVGQGIGGNPDLRPAYIAEHLQSQIDLGRPGEPAIFERSEERTDTTDPTTLAAYAKGQVAKLAYPVPFFDFTATAENDEEVGGEGVPPRFGPDEDYYVGDTVTLRVRPKGADIAERRTYEGRVTDVTITEAANGECSVKSSCGIEIDVANVTGTAYNAWMPDLSSA